MAQVQSGSSSHCLPGLPSPALKARSPVGFKSGPAASDSNRVTESGGRVLPGALALGLPLAPASAVPRPRLSARLVEEAKLEWGGGEGGR